MTILQCRQRNGGTSHRPDMGGTGRAVLDAAPGLSAHSVHKLAALPRGWRLGLRRRQAGMPRGLSGGLLGWHHDCECVRTGADCLHARWWRGSTFVFTREGGALFKVCLKDMTKFFSRRIVEYITDPKSNSGLQGTRTLAKIVRTVVDR